MIKRIAEEQIQEYLNSDSHKILFVWGPRRSGKTTILTKISEKLKVPVFDFGLLSDQEKFPADLEKLGRLVSSVPVILIDEVQNFPEGTVALKALVDHFKVKIVATGSSELRKKSQDFDSLSGRFEEIYCLPLSISEIIAYQNLPAHEQERNILDLVSRLSIFGTYPEVFLAKDETKKIDLLQKILDTYVLKDIVEIYDLRNTKLAADILTKIALQLGSEVSLREIAQSLSANVQTVSNYVEIFVKNYILIPLPSFKTNLRKAVSENKKYYFYDLGIRNILVKDFRELALRPDRGGVFENFIISEITKGIKNKNLKYSMYFYREYGGKEVDLVLEDYEKKYVCLEMKHNLLKGESVFPLSHEYKIITPSNYWQKLSSYLTR